jgi:hypothetical protein
LAVGLSKELLLEAEGVEASLFLVLNSDEEGW